MDQTFEKRKKVIYDFICDDFYIPMKVKEIATVLQVSKEQRRELQEVLDALVEEGKITLSKRGKYSKGQAKRITGTFQANIRGFGFVMVEGEDEDIFIPGENVNGAFQGDEVECIITGAPGGKRKEGKIVRIVSHQVKKIVGLYEKSKSFGFVRPDNQRYLKDIYIPAGKEKGAMDGHKVVVELTSYGQEHAKPEGKIVEIIGHVNDPGADILSIVKDYDLPTEFPEKVLNQAVRVGKDVSEADCAGRLDLRDWQMVTIDGEDAKDLDDGISLTKDGNIYHLGVHIADVSNYVQGGSALDKEALKRGTSVYLADRVIRVIIFTVLFIVFYAFLHIIIVWLNLISRLPILYGLNKIAGAVLGLAEALIFIWVGALVLTLFSGSEIGKSMITQINGSIWLTWLYDHNMLSYLVVGLVKSVL